MPKESYPQLLPLCGLNP